MNFNLIVIYLGSDDSRRKCRLERLVVRRWVPRRWVPGFPTLPQLCKGWAWGYVGCQTSMEGMSVLALGEEDRQSSAEGRDIRRVVDAESVGKKERDSREEREAVTLGAREAGERGWWLR